MSDFYGDTPPQNGGTFSANSPMAGGGATTTQVSPSQQFTGSEQSHSPGPYIDTGMGMDMIREDPEMYMPHADMLALFDEGGVDVAHLFSSQFLPSSSTHHAGRANNEGFVNPAFMKHGGLVTSP